jgi:hypothetical protein
MRGVIVVDRDCRVANECCWYIKWIDLDGMADIDWLCRYTNELLYNTNGCVL